MNMAWGGGNYVTMNKVLPGVYNTVSTSGGIGSKIGTRGTVALGLEGLSWGPDASVFKVTAEEFYKNSMTIFGVPATDSTMKGIRDLFKYATTAYFYKLNTCTKATGTLADAKYGGTAGNNIKIIVSENADDSAKFDVVTYYNNVEKDKQVGVADQAGLTDNEWVVWKDSATLATGTTTLSGGGNGSVTATEYTAWETAIEPYPGIQAIGCLSTTSGILATFVAFVKRLISDYGRTIQGVVYNYPSDNEAIVNVKNGADLVYWATGAIGGVAVNKSLTGKVYDGEFTIGASYTQAQLESAINSGEFVLHKVGDDLKVLKDINSLVTFTAEKNSDLANNQVIRATNAFLDANTASFTTIDLGNTPNDLVGRASVWSRIVANGEELLGIGAFSAFDGASTLVEAGSDRTSIVVTTAFTPATAMDKMYLRMLIN